MKVSYLFAWMNTVFLLFTLVRIFVIGQLLHFDPTLNWLYVFRDMLITFLFGSIMTSYHIISTRMVRKITNDSKRYVIFNIIMNGLLLPIFFYMFFKLVIRVTEGFIIGEILLAYGLGILICTASLISYFSKNN
jgi:hypothetical protein